MKILVLTKNILAEQSIQSKLQLMGYEVFISSGELNKALHLSASKELIQNFEVIILSENLANSEVEHLALSMASFKKKIIRLACNQEKEETENVQYVNINDSFNHLREELANSNVLSKKALHIEGISDLKLSGKERILFNYLQEHDETIISRKTLCTYIWEEDFNDSRMAQLSSIVKKINLKLQKQGNTEKYIETFWGKGYKISDFKKPVTIE